MILLALATAAFTCNVATVTDGDTVRCADGVRVRLAAIDANELHGPCHTTCAVRSATEARDNLARLTLGKTVTVEPTGKSYNRITGWVSVGGLDLSCAQYRGGFAVRWPRYDPTGQLYQCGRR